MTDIESGRLRPDADLARLNDGVHNAPDVSDIDLSEISDLPASPGGNYRILLSTAAYKAIYQHAKTSPDKEICGVLIGEVYKDRDNACLAVTAAIRGEHADNHAGQVMFTHATWEHINSVKDSEFPDQRTVGWYHSHPTFGIFLSPQDEFIHKNFFGAPWQVAFVIDPVSDEEGFFIWRKGEPVRADRHAIDGATQATPQPIVQTLSALARKIDDLTERLSQTKRSRRAPLIALSAAACLALFIAAFFVRTERSVGLLSRSSSSVQEMLARLVGSQVATNDKIDRMVAANATLTSVDRAAGATSPQDKNEAATEIREQLAGNRFLSGLDLFVLQKSSQVWVIGDVHTTFQRDLVRKIAGDAVGIESVDLRGLWINPRYVTVSGDTLSGVAEKLYGNPARWRDIYRENQGEIPDPDVIGPSLVLGLPG
jgi:proteasome lid subunit RPN8/RPN11